MVADGLDEPGLLRVAGDEHGAGLAALEHAVARVEGEAALALLGRRAVALVATFGQHGADALLEEFQVLAGRLGGLRAQTRQPGQHAERQRAKCGFY